MTPGIQADTNCATGVEARENNKVLCAVASIYKQLLRDLKYCLEYKSIEKIALYISIVVCSIIVIVGLRRALIFLKRK